MIHGIEVQLTADIEKYRQGMEAAKRVGSDSMGFISSIFDSIKRFGSSMWDSLRSVFSNISSSSKSAFDSMSDTASGAFQKLGALLPGFNAGLDKTKQKMGETEEKSDDMATKIGVGIVAALAAASAAISAFVAKGLAADTALANVSISGNLAASQISRFEAVALRSNVSAKDFAGSMVKLREEMEKAAAGTGGDVFDKLGVKVVDANNALLKTDEVTIEVAKKIAAMSTEAEKYAAASKLGFEGKVQVLEDIARASDLSATTTDEQAAAVVRLGKIWHDILPGGKSMWAEISAFLTANLMPAMTQASIGILEAKNKISGAFKDIFGAGSMFPSLGDKIKEWGLVASKWLSGVADWAATATVKLMRLAAAKTGLGDANAPLTSVGVAAPGAVPLASESTKPVVKEADKKQLEEYEALTKAIKEKIEVQRMEAQTGASLTEGQRMAVKFATDLRDGVLHLTDAQKLQRTEELASLITQEQANEARKSAAGAADKEATAYASIIASIKSRTEAGRLELAAGVAATDSEKENIKVEQMLASGKLKLSDAHLEVVRGALAQQRATEDLLKAQKAAKVVDDWMADSAQGRNASNAALAAEYALYGQSTDAREIAMVAVKAEADLEKFLAAQRKAGLPIADEMLAQLEAERDMRVDVEQATLAQSKALSYAAQLKAENTKFAAESLTDPKARAEALLAIDVDTWQRRIKLAGDGTEAQRILQVEYTTWYGNQQRRLTSEVDVARATELLKIMEAVDEAAKSAAAGMEASFGRVGAAIGGMTTALTGYARTQQAIAAQLASATQDAKGDPVKIAQATAAAQQQGAQAQVKSYGDMASAAKGFFKENTVGYKVMQTTEQAFRAAEMVMAVESMAKKIVFKEAEVAANVSLNATKLAGEATTSAASTGLAATESSAWGITAVVKALASLPFPANLAAGAATLAAVIAIGAKIFGSLGGGGGESAADVQKAQGTGTVFGDSSAKSDSVRRAIESLKSNSDLLIPINQGMLTSLQSIEASMTGLTNLVVRTTGLTDGTNMGIQTGTIARSGINSTVASIAGGGAAVSALGLGITGIATAALNVMSLGLGAVLGGVAAKIVSLWGKTTQTIVDAGLQYGGSVRGLQDGTGFDQYASVDTTKSSWFGLSKSTSNSVQVQGLNDELSKQFGLIFTNLDKSLQAAAVAMGGSAADVTKVLDSLTLKSTQVSLKGLTGTALTDALNSAISKTMDAVTTAVFPQFEQFRQVGEGYAETVMRIAGDYAKLDSILAASSTTFGATGIASLAARERLIELAGGIDSLASQTNSFTQNFLSKAEQLAPVQKYVTDQLAAMGLQGIDTRDKFKDAVLGLANSGALATEAGAQQYAALLALSDAFAKTHAATVDLTKTEQEIADERTDLQNKLDDLTMTQAQLADKARAAIAGDNLALYDQVQAAQAAKDAITEANSILDLQAQMYAATGDKAGAAAVLEQQHAAALVGMTSALAEATQATWDAQAAAAATKDVLATVSNAYSALQAVVSREKDKLNEAYTAASDALQIGIDAATAAVTKLTSLSQDLHSALDAMAVPGQEKTNRAAAQAQIDAALAIAKAGGPLPDADSLKAALSTVSKDAAGQFASYTDYMRDLYRTKNSVSALSDLSDSQLSAEQLTLKTLQAQKTALDAAHKEDLAALDATLEQAKNQTDLLSGIYTSLMTLPQALAALGVAVAAAKADPGVSATSSLADLYQSVLGRTPDSAGLAFYQSVMAQGTTLDQVRASMLTSPEYQSLHPFAVGTNYIPSDMPAMVHEGERIIPAADNRELMARLQAPASNNAELVAEMKALRAVVEKLQAPAEETAKNTGKAKEVLVRSTQGGDYLMTKAIPA